MDRNNKTHPQTMRNLTAILMLAVVLLASCQADSLMQTIFPEETEESSVIPQASLSPTEEVDEESNSTPTVQTIESTRRTLRVWVPPQFSPLEDLPAATLFTERLQEFENLNPQIQIEVRVKASTGKGNLLETLTSASIVAPETVPALIAFSRSDIEVAISRGLIFPIGNYSAEADSSDWYEYAREIAQYKNVAYGLPFAGDALVILSDKNQPFQDATTWDALRRQARKIAFPADDPQAWLGFALYQSTKGKLQDQQGQISLQEDALLQLLEEIRLNVLRNVFINETSNFQTYDQIWQNYLNGQWPAVVTWSSNYLQSPIEYNIYPLPAIEGDYFTLARGWVWCLADNDPEIAEIAMQLAEFLIEKEYLAQWSQSIGYLPVRPSSLTAWQNREDFITISGILNSAHNRPDTEIVNQIGPILREAIKAILLQEKTPEAAVESALDQIEALKAN